MVGADLVAGQPITASTTAGDTITYQHMLNAVAVTKSPSGAQSPSAPIPYQLSFTNTGDAPIIDPVITDLIPSDASGPLLRLDPDLPPGTSPYDFTLTGDAPTEPHGTPLPERVDEVTVTASPTQLTFTFPAGSVLEPGQTYRIGVALLFRAGLPGNTAVTNTTGITGDRPWDTCTAVLDDATGECRAASSVYPVLAGALRGVKKVRAVDQELGVLNTRGLPGGCIADADGFHVGGCVPVTKPGSDEVWRMTFTNTGNLPMDRVFAIDRLPTPGDTGAIVALPRESAWRPTLKDVALVGATGGAVSGFRTFYTSDPALCTDDLILGGTCDPADWLPWTTAVDPSSVVALKFEIDMFQQFLAPLGTVTLDLTTTTPAVSPVSGPDTIAWNTTAAAGRTNDGGILGIAPRSEGNKVGVALATGPLQVIKEVTGPAAEFAPSSFTLQVQCTSVGQQIDLGDDGTLTAVDGEISGILNLPWGSACTVADDRESSGATDFDATTVTIQRDPQTVPLVIATNTYDDASLTLAKAVQSAAVDADGVPVTYGPFEFAVSCTFLGSPVTAAGFEADPMVVTLADGASSTLTDLPAGSSCSVAETDDKGAISTALVVTTTSGSTPVDGSDTTVVLSADDAGTTVTATNSYGTGSLEITKVVDGPAAELVGSGPFTVAVRCVLDDDSGSRIVWDGTVVLGGELPLLATLDDIAAGAECAVTEPDDGGATTTAVTPGEIVVGVDQLASVTITNTFEVGAIRIDKTVSGDGAAYGTGPFQVEVSCTFQGISFEIPGGARRTIVPGTPVVYDALPVGASCTVAETVSGGATSVSIGEATGPTVTVTVPQETLELALDNTFDVGEIRVLKRLAGPGAAAHQGDEFTFRLACTWVVDGTTVPVPLPADSAVASAATDWLATFSGVPYGSLCEITETDSADADRIVVTVDGRTSELDPGDAAAQEAWLDLEAATATCLTVEFVNVWGSADVVPLPSTELAEISGCVEIVPTSSSPVPTPSPSPSPSSPPSPGPGVSPGLPNTGVAVGPMLGWAALLLTAGLGLALATRRRSLTSRG